MGYVYVTVLAMDKYKASENIKIGDMVELVREPANQYDINAIKVMKGKEQIGYLANNSEKTVVPGTSSATNLNGTIFKITKAKILRLYHDSHYMKQFIAVIVPETEKTKQPEKKKELSFALIGGFTTFPGKKELIEAIKSGKKLVNIIKETNGTIIASYNNKAAGKVKADEETMKIISDYLDSNPEVIAVAIRNNKANVICTMEIKDGIKTKKIETDNIINRIIKEKINTQEEINEKIEYLKANKVSDENIGLLFESYVKYPEKIANRIPKKPKILFVDSENYLVSNSVYYINAKKNLIFEGDKGVGKNVLTETLAWLYNRPLYEFSSNSQHSNNSLLGGQTFVSKNKQEEKKNNKILANFFARVMAKLSGVSKPEEEEITSVEKLIKNLSNDKELKFEMSSILEAFVNGGILVLDEFNTSLAHVMPIFNALLDDRRRIEVTGLGLAVGHPNFCAIATQNKDYEGTFEANEATADRFEPIIFPPLTSISEILKERVPDIDYETLTLADNLYQGIKASAESGEMGDKILSIRGFISACEVIGLGMDKKQAFINSVANRASDLDDRKSIRNMIELSVK